MRILNEQHIGKSWMKSILENFEKQCIDYIIEKFVYELKRNLVRGMGFEPTNSYETRPST